MRLPTRPATGRSRSRFLYGQRLIRIRLWLAMLGLAILPMVGVLLIVTSLAPKQAPADDRHAWETATAAAALTEAEHGVEARLLGAAAASDVQGLVDGVSSSERTSASALVAAIEGNHPGLVESACITRTLDGSQVELGTLSVASPAASACTSTTLVEQALEARPGTVVRGTRWGSDRSRRMVLATELPGTSRRSAGVLAVEFDLADLFAATPEAAGIGTSAVLVDLDQRDRGRCADGRCHQR